MSVGEKVVYDLKPILDAIPYLFWTVAVLGLLMLLSDLITLSRLLRDTTTDLSIRLAKLEEEHDNP